jgi:hypothetical protein
MSDIFTSSNLTPATTGSHNNQGLVASDRASSLSQLAFAIATSQALQPVAQVKEPLIIDPDESGQTLSPEQKLQMYLTVARRSQQIPVMENAFALALRAQRTIVSASLSSTMPTALKIKTCEIPVLKLFLEFGLRSPEWRALVVRMLCDNVETGTGHLTVNRAKQVLKELAKRAGAKVLAGELKAETAERRMAAITLLGWLKHERAIEPLVTAFDRVSSEEQLLIITTLETHYLPKLAYHLKWRHQSPTAVAGPLLALLATA